MERRGLARRVLSVRPMHPLTYEIKRTHWAATWEAIRYYRDVGKKIGEPTLADMTPARCDILQTVWDHNEDLRDVARAMGRTPTRKRFMHLADVRKKLGLAGVTVWKCVQGLVELEWVWLEPDPTSKKRLLIVHLTELGVHALRMAQLCAETDFVDLNNVLRTCFDRRVEKFVHRDAEQQQVVARPGEPPQRRTFRSVSDYFWWLVEYVRSMAKHFNCKAERLYFREAHGQLVQEWEDTWFEFDDAEDGSPYDPDEEERRWMAPVTSRSRTRASSRPRSHASPSA